MADYYVLTNLERASFRVRNEATNEEFEPIQLADGNWAFNTNVLSVIPEPQKSLLQVKTPESLPLTAFKWKVDYDLRRASAVTSVSGVSVVVG